MTRLPNWQSLYAAFLTNQLKVPFAWGTNDCCTYAADAIKGITGTDIAEDFRGYTTEAGAFAAIAKVTGGSTVADALTYCSTKYKMAELSSVLLAQRGDLLLVNNLGQLIAGVVDMHGRASCVTDTGLISFQIRSATKAYRT